MAQEDYGWIDDPREVGLILNQLPHPLLRCTKWSKPLLAAEPRDVMFWELERKGIGSILRAHYQRRGTCVGQGWARNIQHAILADRLIRGELEEWYARVLPASIYGFSRVEIGGGRVRGDGSIGAWAAQAAKEKGVLLRMPYPDINLAEDDDDAYCVAWGDRGVPDALEPFAAEHTMLDVSLVTDLELGLGCLWNWIPIPTCSNQGFTTTRDKYGMCHPSGSWAHCMATSGAVKIKHPNHPSGLQTVGLWQSWGQNSPDGNDRVTLQTGQEITLPPGVFLIDAEVWGRMLRAGDSFGIASIRGWKPTKQDWILLALAA